MGGKIWTEAEERHFWRVAVSESTKRAGVDRWKQEKSWDNLAVEMQHAMGDNARRQYTGNMLFEHFFQNTEIQRRSPNAYPYVQEYLAKKDYTPHLASDHSNPSSSATPPNSRRSQYIQLVTEPDTTGYSQTRSPHSAPNEASFTDLAPTGSPESSKPGVCGSREILNSPETVADTPITTRLPGDEDSELEEGEIRE